MKLNDVRKKIDNVDSELLTLLSERMLLSIRAGRLKKKIEDRKREEEIVDNLKERKDNLISYPFLETIYNDILQESKRLQSKNFRLAGFQGERGAFGEVACRLFDKSLVPVPCLEFSDVFDGITKGELDYGVVPIENSSEGAITAVSHLVTEKGLYIVGEVVLPVHHALLSLPDVSREEIRVVYSHPQALAQCRDFISKNRLEPRPFYDTAGAAAMIAREKPIWAAAVASRDCSNLYGLKVISENIEDSKANVTRFLVLSRERIRVEGNKCTVMFSTRDKAGALSSVLGLFKEAGINLTMIESIPSRDSTGKAKFLIDFNGNYGDKKTQTALDKITAVTTGLKILGCYKRWSQ